MQQDRDTACHGVKENPIFASDEAVRSVLCLTIDIEGQSKKLNEMDPGANNAELTGRLVFLREAIETIDARLRAALMLSGDDYNETNKFPASRIAWDCCHRAFTYMNPEIVNSWIMNGH